MSLFTRSNAFEKSIKHTYRDCPMFNCLSIRPFSKNKSSDVRLSLMKPPLHYINDVTILNSTETVTRFCLANWGRVTHICVSELTIIGSDNGSSPGRRQVIIWTNAGIMLIGALGTNFSEILIEIYTFSLKKMHLKGSSGKWRPYCLGLNVLNHWYASRDA